MKRRKAILSIFLLGAGAAVTYTGFRAFHLHKTPDWNFLSNNIPLIGELAELLIPETDTPGAKSAGVGEVVAHLVAYSARRVDQNNFIEGLKVVQRFCIDEFGRDMTKLTNEEKLRVMVRVSKEDEKFSGVLGKIENRLTGRPFFYLLKEYSSIAYCTSEIGATKGLAYDHIPGKYSACIPLTKGQHSWATK
jgi:hypothetical protein